MADEHDVDETADFEAVLASAQAGYNWAVAVLFHDLQPRLLRFLRSQEPRVADDLASETWVAIASGIGTFTGNEQGFRAWAFTIARRRLVEHRRRAGRRRTEVAEDSTFASIESSEAPERDALDRLSAGEAVARITAILTPYQAEVVLLRVLGDLSAAEVGQAMGRSENWVRVTQHRALRRLADTFSAQIGVTR